MDDLDDMKGQEIWVVILYKSRHTGTTVQEEEMTNSLTGQGSEMTQALMQEFFDSREFDICTVITEDNNCVQFSRENGDLKVAFYPGSSIHEPEKE